MVLENGVAQTARQIRTGQAQNGNVTQAQFRTALCNQISFLLSCDASKLYIDVRDFASFGNAAYPPPLDANGNINPNLNSFQTGSSSNTAGASDDIVLVRAFYTYRGRSRRHSPPISPICRTTSG